MNLIKHQDTVPRRPLAPQGQGAILRFTEEMKGYVTLTKIGDSESAARGASPSALMFHLDITVPDVASFVRDPSHEAKARGFIRGALFGGDRPVEDGSLELLFEDQSSAFKLMRYHLPFTGLGGEPFTLSGIKQVRNDPGCDLWADTSTLYTSIVRGHMPISAAPAAEVVATGVLYIHPRDFLKQLRTLSVDAPTAAGRSAALARFGKFFLRSLWDVYAERVA
jgi:cholesterol oxidase